MAGEPIIEFDGNIGGDPELRKTPQGISVTTFSVAVTASVKEAEGWRDGDTTWFRVTCWDEDARSAYSQLSKGQRVHVRGRLTVHNYTSKDGTPRMSLEVTAERRGVLKPLGRERLAEQQEVDPWATTT